MSRRTEPCLCGDPECPRCFPFQERPERDPDDIYDEQVQEEYDEATRKEPQGHEEGSGSVSSDADLFSRRNHTA